jgi:hypothetical protein
MDSKENTLYQIAHVTYIITYMCTKDLEAGSLTEMCYEALVNSTSVNQYKKCAGYTGCFRRNSKYFRRW